MDLRPMGDRVVVEPVEQEETTPGGIVIPDTAKEKPQRGRVRSVGPGRVAPSGDRLPVEVQAGDLVVYASYAGTEVKLNGNTYLILPETDILAVVEE